MANSIFIFIIFFLLIVLFQLMRYVYRTVLKRQALKRLMQSGIPYIDQMDGFQFKMYLKALFQQLGYKAQLTPQSGDFGADLIMKGKKKIVIQAKRYGVKNKVSQSSVREVYGAQAYYEADEAWVMTNSFFTKQAKVLAEVCHVQLFDRHALQSLILEVNPIHTAEDIYREVKPEPRTCPVCGSSLVIHHRNGERFFGCVSFPQCDHTEAINKE